MSIRLEKIRSEFWDYQATVSEDGIIAKIMRVIEKPPSIRIDLLTDDEHETLNTYETIGFFNFVETTLISRGLADLNQASAIFGYKHEVDIAWHKVGQAQLWYSTTSKVCVLWECLAFGDMKPRAKEFWEWTLKYCESLGMEKIYTHDRDPAYDDNYKIFLESLGFELVRERTMHWVRR